MQSTRRESGNQEPYAPKDDNGECDVDGEAENAAGGKNALVEAKNGKFYEGQGWNADDDKTFFDFAGGDYAVKDC